MNSPKVMIVDDDMQVLLMLREWLEVDGCEVFSATNGSEALRCFVNNAPSLVVTDLRMKGMDGFQLIGRIREMSDVHVVALTALSDEEHMIRCLELGADDYLVKPVRKRLFTLRIRGLLRRASTPEGVVASYKDSSVDLDFLTHEVRVRGAAVKLRPTEFRILALLAQNQDRVIGHDELLDKVWGDHAGSLDSLKWYISALRQKIEPNPKQPNLIVNVPRVGYRYASKEAAAIA